MPLRILKRSELDETKARLFDKYVAECGWGPGASIEYAKHEEKTLIDMGINPHAAIAESGEKKGLEIKI